QTQQRFSEDCGARASYHLNDPGCLRKDRCRGKRAEEADRDWWDRIAGRRFSWSRSPRRARGFPRPRTNLRAGSFDDPLAEIVSKASRDGLVRCVLALFLTRWKMRQQLVGQAYTATPAGMHSM